MPQMAAMGPVADTVGASGRSEDKERPAENLGALWADAAGKTGWVLI